MLTIFCVYLLYIYLYWFVCFLVVEFWEIFVCYGHMSFIRYVFGKYVPLVCDWSFYYLTVSEEEQKCLFLRSTTYQIVLLWFLLFLSYLRNFCLIQGYKDFPLCFLPEFV